MGVPESPRGGITVNVQGKLLGIMHCSHVGPHLGTLVPMGTKISFLVPIFFSKSPFSPF